jgi:hypothetical protein
MMFLPSSHVVTNLTSTLKICNNGKKHKIKRNFFVPLILVVARKHNKKIPKKLIALPNPIFVRKHI